MDKKIAIIGAGGSLSTLHKIAEEHDAVLVDPSSSSMKKKIFELAALSTMVGGEFKLPKLKGKNDRRPKPTPPRSMTTEELNYYRKYKTLERFKS